MQAQRVADLVLYVTDDGQSAVSPDTLVEKNRLGDNKFFVVQNKIDLTSDRRGDASAHVSAKTGEGLELLRRRVLEALTCSQDDWDRQRDRPSITNVRHAALIQRAHEALIHAREAGRAGNGALPEEFLLADLQVARDALEEVAGRRAPEDLITHIFNNFCIGK